MYRIALLPVLLALLSTAAARRDLLEDYTEKFPPYGCERDAAVSPFRLEGAYTTTPSPNGQRVCVRGAAVQACPPGNPCCSSADFYKLELRVNPTCKNAIRSVTVNGRMAPVPTYETYGAARNKALIKMPKLNLTTDNVTNAIICFTLRNPCPNIAALCPEADGTCTYAIVQSAPFKCCPVNRLGVVAAAPSGGSGSSSNGGPPSSSPRPNTSRRSLLAQDTAARGAFKLSAGSAAASQEEPRQQQQQAQRQQQRPGAFPFPVQKQQQQQCDSAAGLMPFKMSGAPVASRTAAGNNLYCFSLTSAACSDPSSGCCTAASLLKVEWWSYDVCRGSVAAAYIDKSRYPSSWDQGGTFRLTKLGWSAADVAAAPKQLCIELRAGSPCDTIDRFCNTKQCVYSLYDNTKMCCPTSAVPESR